MRLEPVGYKNRQPTEKIREEDEDMVGENWTTEEKRKLKAMTISPIASSPKRLKEMIEYFPTWRLSMGRHRGTGTAACEQIAWCEGQGLC